MLIAGDDDISKGAVSFRYRNGEQRNGVPIAEAIDGIATKLVRRHPHVFTPDGVPLSDVPGGMTAGDVVKKWEDLKAAEQHGEDADPLGEVVDLREVGDHRAEPGAHVVDRGRQCGKRRDLVDAAANQDEQHHPEQDEQNFTAGFFEITYHVSHLGCAQD